MSTNTSSRTPSGAAVLPVIVTATSVTVISDGKALVSQEGDIGYADVRRAVDEGRYADLPELVSPARFVTRWSRGNFRLTADGVTYLGNPLPPELHDRILGMARAGEDPTPFMNFWEKLQKNPSYRSVQQLFRFLEHQHIPLTQSGDFLAYKAITVDKKDKHSRKVSNEIGLTNSMPRNQVSDDPSTPCHFGFHVGNLEYVRSFAAGDDVIVVCRVNPEHVVAVPYDASSGKMRVCEYRVEALYDGKPLPSTVDSTYDAAAVAPLPVEKPAVAPLPVEKPAVAPLPIEEPVTVSPRESELMAQKLDDLRAYAKTLGIANVKKIPFGKAGLVPRILAAEAGNAQGTMVVTPKAEPVTPKSAPAQSTPVLTPVAAVPPATKPTRAQLEGMTLDALRKYATSIGVPRASRIPGGGKRLIEVILKHVA